MSLSFRNPSPKVGAKVPLWDRFVDEDPNDTQDADYQPVLNEASVQKNIIDDVQHLLSTRAMRSEKDLFRSPHAFGLPDLYQISPAAPSHWPKIEALILRVLKAYEPRLSQIQVHIKAYDHRSNKLFLQIQANYSVTPFKGQFHFPMEVDFGWIRAH